MFIATTFRIIRYKKIAELVPSLFQLMGINLEIALKTLLSIKQTHPVYQRN